MSRLIDFTLNDEQLAAVEQAMNHAPQPEVRQRAIAIRLLHLGHQPEVVADMLAVAASTIWNWHRRYRAGGISGLANRAKSGRPAKADDHYLAEVERTLDSDPRALGYAFSVWTINKLRKHLAKQTGINVPLQPVICFAQSALYRIPHRSSAHPARSSAPVSFPSSH